MKNFVYVVKLKDTKIKENKENIKYLITNYLKDRGIRVKLNDISKPTQNKFIDQKINSIKNDAAYKDSDFMPPYYIWVDENVNGKKMYRRIDDLDTDLGIDNIEFIKVYSYRC